MTDLLAILQKHQVNFSCVNRVELDRQHLAGVDLMVAVGGDGTVLSAAHFLDHGTIPLLGINSDPNVRLEDYVVKKKSSDERRSHGALCMCTALDMEEQLVNVVYGAGSMLNRTRIRCKVKSTFSETLLVPALNDMLLANPSPAAVSRFRMGWLKLVPEGAPSETYGTVTRFGGKAYDVTNSLNVWSSGMWVCTATGSTAAMAAAGGQPMDADSDRLQYLIREHMIERHQPAIPGSNGGGNGSPDDDVKNNGMVNAGEKYVSLSLSLWFVSRAVCCAVCATGRLPGSRLSTAFLLNGVELLTSCRDSKHKNSHSLHRCVNNAGCTFGGTRNEGASLSTART